MAGKTAVVLGGGIGGLVAARELRRRLDAGDRVVLVDKTGRHVYAPSLLWVMEGARRPEYLVRDLTRLRRRGIEVVQAEATAIAVDRKTVETTDGAIPYDALVVAVGADLAPAVLPGFADAALTPYEPDGASKVRAAVARFDGGRLVVMVSSLPFKCPAAPYEAALLIDHAYRRRGIRDRVEIELVTPEPQPMLVAGPAIGSAIEGMLRSRGIGFRPNVKPVSIDPGSRVINVEASESIPFDLLVGVPPHRPPKLARASGLANEAGWIPVDRHTMATGAEGVYAIGDVTAIPLASGKMLPKAGVFAERQAKVAAANISAVLGSGASALFDGSGGCFVDMGGGVAGFATGDFYNEPDPAVSLRGPGRKWHWGKVLFEKWWMWRWAP